MTWHNYSNKATSKVKSCPSLDFGFTPKMIIPGLSTAKIGLCGFFYQFTPNNTIMSIRHKELMAAKKNEKT